RPGHPSDTAAPSAPRVSNDAPVPSSARRPVGLPSVTGDHRTYRKQEQEPATDEITELAPGVLRSQLPVQLPGLGHVNCYLLEDERGVALVDPGLPGPDSWRALLDRLHR